MMYDLIYDAGDMPIKPVEVLARYLVEIDFGAGRWMPSPKQLEVVRLLAAGLRHKQIADRMSISQKTVASHIEDVRKKSRSKTMVQAVIQCHKLGII
jgi:DNA-binding CsgD family transcriptional regulator